MFVKTSEQNKLRSHPRPGSSKQLALNRKQNVRFVDFIEKEFEGQTLSVMIIGSIKLHVRAPYKVDRKGLSVTGLTVICRFKSTSLAILQFNASEFLE
jgi:hypothetical protein